jgi:hypothetical protein
LKSPALRVGLLAALALSITVALPPVSASAYAPASSPGFFGVNGAMLRNLVDQDKAARLDALTTSMGQQGISWARLTFDQSMEEPQRGTFNWYTPDTIVAALARHGVRGAAAFVGTAPYTADPSAAASCPWAMAYPANLTAWSEWVAASVRRYGENGSFWRAHPELPKLPIRTWEIGNEVNSATFWCPGADPEQYAKVFSASATAIKAVDPAAQVVVGGLAPRFGWEDDANLKVSTFLNRMIAANPTLRNTIDAVAIHPYAASVDSVLGAVYEFRAALTDAGMPQTPMLVNEFGWYTQGPAGMLLATESQRADMIGAAVNKLWRTDCGISGVAPYSWVTMEQNSSDPEDWFGLADAQTGSPHPSGIAYGDQIRLALGQAAQPPPQDKVTICSGNVAVSKVGSGTVTSAPVGLDCGQVCAFRFGIATSVTLTATAAPGYAFRGWTGCDSVSGDQCTVGIMADRSPVTATFVAQRRITVQRSGSGAVSGGGIDCGSSCDQVVDDGTQVTLTATPATGSAFRGWTGCDSVSGDHCTVSANADRTIAASFATPRTVSVRKSGSGTVSGPGVDCGPTCSTVADEGTQLALTATPAPGYAFAGWTGCDSVSGNRCSVTVAAGSTVTANFVAQRILTVRKSGAGVVTAAGISCGAVCTAVVEDGTQVTLAAPGTRGYRFRGWSGCDSVTGTRCTVTLRADRMVTATFVRNRQKSGRHRARRR